MAHTTGTGVGDAMATLETSAALDALPAVADSSTESELLQAAATRSLKCLKERAAQVRAGARSAQRENARYLRGSIVHWYPYPLIDVTTLGYGKAVLNCAWVALFVFGLAAGATALDGRLARSSPTA